MSLWLLDVYKRQFKYLMMVVVAIAGLSLASCSDDDDNYTVGEASDGAYLYTDIQPLS